MGPRLELFRDIFAMRMSDERRIAASRETVWAALNDTDVLRRSLPGCETLEAGDDGTLIGSVTAAVGPVRARFRGKVRLSDIDPPNGWRITGESQSGSAGFANGTATVALIADGEDTIIKYDVEATVGGKLAQIGSRVVDSAAHRMAEDFFARFSRIVADRPRPESQPPVAAPAGAARGLSPVLWVPALIVVVVLFALLIT